MLDLLEERYACLRAQRLAEQVAEETYVIAEWEVRIGGHGR